MKAAPLIIGGLALTGLGIGGYFLYKNLNPSVSSGSGSGSGTTSSGSSNTLLDKGTALLNTGTATVDKIKNAVSSITGNSDRSKIDQQVYTKVAAMYPSSATVSAFNDYLSKSSSGKAGYSNSFVRVVTEKYWAIMKAYGAEPRPKGTFGYKDVSGIMNSQVLPEFFKWLSDTYGPGLSGFNIRTLGELNLR